MKQNNIPSNWTEYLHAEHKELELSNSEVVKIKKDIQNLLNFDNHKSEENKNLLKEILRKNKKIIKMAITDFGNHTFFEIFISTKISKRLIRIKNPLLEDLFLDKEHIIQIGNNLFFQFFSNRFTFI